MNSTAFDGIKVSPDNEELCRRFASMCDELKVRISDVSCVWSGSEYSDDPEDETQFINGQVERIGTNGTFKFILGDLSDDWGEHLVGVYTDCHWDGHPDQGAEFFRVCSTDDPCMHSLYDLRSVLSIVSFERNGKLWIDSYPVKCYEGPGEDENH